MLSVLFLLCATVYSSVGFGGGSTYLALLLLWDVPYHSMPVIALCCNIVVVIGNCVHHVQKKQYDISAVWPYLLGSIPMAYIGGTLNVSKEVFQVLLLVILSLASVMLMRDALRVEPIEPRDFITRKIPNIVALCIGGMIGILSGIVGIGGGILLSPILFLFRLVSPQFITSSVAFFILCNSISGLCGHIMSGALSSLDRYMVLIVAVLIGCQIGNYARFTWMNIASVKFTTAVITMVVAIRILVIFV